jgi:hypothetical protein
VPTPAARDPNPAARSMDRRDVRHLVKKFCGRVDDILRAAVAGVFD